MALDLKHKLARLGAPIPVPPAISDGIAPPSIEEPSHIRPRGRPLPGLLENTKDGPLHRIDHRLDPTHRHGKVSISRARTIGGPIAAALALDPSFAEVDLSRMLLLDTETTGLSGGTGTLPFLIGMAWFEDESLRIEQLLLRRPGEERPLLARLAERMRESSCIVTYNGKSFDWPLLRTRAVINRVPVPPPRAHLDLLHCARRIFSRRLGQVRLVHIETEVLGMCREHDVDGAAIPYIYWDFVRGAEESILTPVIEHNVNDLIALAALLATLGERWESVPDAHEPADRLGVARLALRHGDHERASRFAKAAAIATSSADLRVDALLIASQSARARSEHEEVSALLLQAIGACTNEQKRAAVHLALAKHLEHRCRDPLRALTHAPHTAMAEGATECAKRLARLERKHQYQRERATLAGSRSKRRERTKAGFSVDITAADSTTPCGPVTPPPSDHY